MCSIVDGGELIARRHPEWRENQLRWRWLLDSLEGGERYRDAVYGYDRRGFPVRNLIRHKREYPEVGGVGVAGQMGLTPAVDQGLGPAASTDDDYELRRARTPVPTFVAEAVETHLSRIYAREVRRVGPEDLMVWWGDVDGCGTSVSQWMAETVAPLLMTLGQLDVLLDHPPVPEGEVVETRADVERLGLGRCFASVILPEDLLWWRLDATARRYLECVVREFLDDGNGAVAQYRRWTAEEWELYDAEGTLIGAARHGFGRVPIQRLFDRRKPRCRNVGQSRYEGIAERQREYYNRDSELILSDTTQAHPLLQGPEDFVQADGTVPIGPSWLLPKKKNSNGGSTTYEGFGVVEFPKDGAESLRKNKADLRDDVDRDSALIRTTARDGSAQSGLAKAIDNSDGNNRLAKVARTLAKSERLVAELASVVLREWPGMGDASDGFEIVYPTEFDLYTAGDVASATADFQGLVANAGVLPRVEGLMLGRLVRLCLPGLDDFRYAECDAEIAGLLASRQESSGKTGPAVISQTLS